MIERFKYIVVGRGMMGVAAARHLSEWTDGIALIGPDEPADYRSHEGVFGSHYDESRITRTIDPDPVWAQLANRSIARYGEISSKSGIDFYVNSGYLLVGPERNENQLSYVGKTLATANKIGVEIETLGDRDLAERFPIFGFPPGNEGVLETESAGHINPRKLLKAQALIAENNGAKSIVETVESVRQIGGQAMVKTLEGSRYFADKILVAAGGFSINKNLHNSQLGLRVFGRTVVFFEIQKQAMDIWRTMPSLIWKRGENEYDIYILPPVCYPNGKIYLKIGGDPDDILLESESDICSWFRSGGRESTRRKLVEIARALMPKLNLRHSLMAACVTSFTPTGYPVIAMKGEVAGNQTGPSRIGILSGGCGAAAKSSDELGRLGAEMIFHGRIIDTTYRDWTDFRVSYFE